jgi:hypothetical protein
MIEPLGTNLSLSRPPPLSLSKGLLPVCLVLVVDDRWFQAPARYVPNEPPLRHTTYVHPVALILFPIAILLLHDHYHGWLVPSVST